MKLRGLLVIAMLVVAGGAVYVAVMGLPAAGSTRTQYLTATASRTTVTKSIAADGSVAVATSYGLSFGNAPSLVASSSSNSAASNNSSSATWPVKTVSVKPGDIVKQNQTLATADTSDLTAQLAQLQASLTSATSTLAQAQDTLAGAKDSIQRQLDQATTSETIAEIQLKQAKEAHQNATGTDAIRQTRISLLQSQTQLANAKQNVQDLKSQLAGDLPSQTSAVANAQSQVDSLNTQIADLQDQISRASLVAPVAGTVSAVNIVAGYNAPSGNAIVLDGTTLQLTANVVEADLTSVALGQTASVAITALGGTVQGTVTAIAPTATTSSGSVVNYPVTITLTDPPATTRPGMSANVSITVAQAANVIAVPSTALEGTAGNYRVMVMDSTGTPQARTVTVGLITESLTEIQSGVSEGDVVVTGTASSAAQSTGGTQNTGFPGGGLGGFPGGGGGFTRGGGLGR